MFPRIIKENAGRILLTVGILTALAVQCPHNIRFLKDQAIYGGKRFYFKTNTLGVDIHGNGVRNQNQRAMSDYHTGALGSNLVDLEKKVYEAVPGNKADRMMPGESYLFIGECGNKQVCPDGGMTGSELEKAVQRKIDSIQITYNR